jgi:H+-transporting ATPase
MNRRTEAKKTGTKTIPKADRETLEALEQRLGFSEAGLTNAEVQGRQAEYGYNEITEKKKNPVIKFLSYYWGPIPWMIEAAIVLSAIVRHWVELAIIAVLLAVNGVIGFWEEYQAGNTIEALKAKLALRARVKRDGSWATVEARELVPGDLIRVRLGDIIPADATLLEGDPIQVDQSALTGESLPVQAGTEDTVYSGSVVKQGEADALVHATGSRTYFGKTAGLVEQAHTVSHFQRTVLKIGDYLIVIALALVLMILAVSLFRGDNMLTTIQFALILTVAAIPVALPTVLSVTMAAGARILAKKQAIVSRLSSIEEMAGIDTLCSDKTGTLTQNRLTLGEVFTVNSFGPQQVIHLAALASRAENQDPIDLAILEKDTADGHEKVNHFQPFDPVHKRTEATITDSEGRVYKVTKGAPQVILSLASDGAQVGKQVEEAIQEFAGRGYRCLGVARSEENQRSWSFAGLLPLYDPPREDSKEIITSARDMGINVKMVTGDQLAIAREIGRQLDVGRNIMNADMFSETRHHEIGRQADAIEKADGFAQVFPEHKFHIVDVLQQRKHIVGMTGDGVNDAPALKKADAGIAVSGATDAARSAADIVLLSPGLGVIIDAIRESRKIFRRMNSYAIYRIAETIRVLLFMTLSILVFNFYPVTAVMIVLLALLNDGAILSIAYDRVRYSPRPEAWDLPVVLGMATVLGVAGVIASFGMFYLGERVFHFSRDFLQTLMYLKLSVAGHLTIFLTRTEGPFWSSKPAPILIGAVLGTQLLATIFAVFGVFMTPIGWIWAAFVWGYALIWFFVNDMIKQGVYRVFSSHHPGLLGVRPRRG